MKTKITLLFVVSTSIVVSGCATAPLSQQALGKSFPVAGNATGTELALITFSADKKYESPKGVPLAGDPLICGREGIFRVNDENAKNDQVNVKAGEELAVSTVIRWVNTGWRKTCWPFVAFTPESGAKYIVVNERIGGKGVSALWTGVAFQTCEVSVYKESSTGFQRVETRKSSISSCQSTEQ